MPKGRLCSPRCGGKKIEASTRGHEYKGREGYESYKKYMREYMKWYRTVCKDGYLAGRKREKYNAYMRKKMREYRKKLK
jgi:hypothetical protein